MRTRRYFVFGIFCALFAIFLRVDRGNWLREHITHFIGYVARAALEHLLIAIAIPLVLAFLAEAITWRLELSQWLQKFRKNYKTVPDTLDAYVKRDITFYLVAGFATFYAVFAFAFEWQQAYVSVYRSTARGYVQWEQVAADITGSLLAILLAWRFRFAAPAMNPLSHGK